MKLSRFLGFIFSSIFAASAFAHSGHLHQESATNFMEGLQHPFNGLDHFLAMLAVGIYGALSTSNWRMALRAPAGFAVLLLVGALLGLTGFSLPSMEPAIAASVLIFGLLILSRNAFPPLLSKALIGVFALFHGVAHGSEIPGSASLISAVFFLAGMLLATLSLHTFGLFIGQCLRSSVRVIVPVLGSTLALIGIGLLSQTL